MMKQKQLGAALIVALFIMSLVAVAAIAMIERLQIDMRRTTLLLNDVKADFYGKGSISWAMDQLKQNWEKKQTNKIIDATPIVLPASVVDEATIQSVIEDAEGRFNVNNIVDVKYRDDFARLIHNVLPNIDMTQAKQLTQNCVDWLTHTTAHDDDYATLHPPYRVSHQLMASVSELRLVKGFNAEIFNALLPYIIALPETTPINMNSADIPVFMAISPTLSVDAAKNIMLARVTTPFISTQQVLQLDMIKNNPIPEDKMTVVSSYFLVKTTVKVASQELRWYTLLQRVQQQATASENIIWQSKGTL